MSTQPVPARRPIVVPHPPSGPSLKFVAWPNGRALDLRTINAPCGEESCDCHRLAPDDQYVGWELEWDDHDLLDLVPSHGVAR